MTTWTDLIAAIRADGGPAPALRPALLSQCIIESARGTSRLAIDHYNFAGLKWRPEMTGFATKVSYGAHDGVADYCAFTSPAAFVRGYWAFIARPVYHGWQAHAQDPAGYIAFLKSREYAGDPDYVEKVTGRFTEARNLLGDVGAAPVEKDRPPRSQLGDTIGDRLTLKSEPEFVAIAGVVHAFRGRRPNGLEGAIVHYDAGRDRPRRGTDDDEFGARNTLNGAVTNGYAYCTISRTGKIYLPANMTWDHWGYHAGSSKCPATGREGVSQYYVGFEVNSPGLVYPTANADIYVPWFNSVRDSEGRVIFDSKGRVTVLDSTDVTYRKAELRHFSKPDGNIRPGAYVPYTTAQMAALATVMLWLKRQYPGSFRLERVYGHDEVSPGRKVDPGGSLGAEGGAALTMAGFRAELLKTWAKILT